MTRHVAIVGDIINGCLVYGPFFDQEEAAEFGRQSDDQWVVAMLHYPSDEEDE